MNQQPYLTHTSIIQTNQQQVTSSLLLLRHKKLTFFRIRKEQTVSLKKECQRVES